MAVLLWVLLSTNLATAETPAEKGYRIANAAKEHGRGFQSTTATGELILGDRYGNRSVRTFRAKAMEGDDGGNMSMVIFERPLNIAGLALLTHVNENSDNDQWLYFPSIKRVKRISSSAQSSSFAGSEFSYEDLIGSPLEDFEYEWLREEACPGLPDAQCDVIGRFPKNPDSGYRRQMVWMEQEEYLIPRVDFYDRKDVHLKTLVTEGFKRYERKYWRPDVATMTNHRTGKTSVLKWIEHDFTVELNANDFSRRALGRAK